MADATALDHRDLVESHYPEAEYVLVELNGFVEVQRGEPNVRKSLVCHRIILSSVSVRRRTIKSSATTTTPLRAGSSLVSETFEIFYVDLIFKCL